MAELPEGVSRASLRVVSSSLDAAEITRLMGVEPEKVRVWPDATVWTWCPEDVRWEGFGAFDPVLDYLEANGERVAAVSTRARVDVFVGYSGDDVEVDAVVPRRLWETLADKGVAVLFDLGPPTWDSRWPDPDPPSRKWYRVEVTERGAPRSGLLVEVVDDDRIGSTVCGEVLRALSEGTAGKEVQVTFTSNTGQGGFGFDSAVVSAIRDAVTPVRFTLVLPPVE